MRALVVVALVVGATAVQPGAAPAVAAHELDRSMARASAQTATRKRRAERRRRAVGRRVPGRRGRPARPSARPVAGLWAGVPVAGATETTADPAPSATGPGAAPAPAAPGPAKPAPSPVPTYVPELPGQAERSVAVRSTEWAFTLSQPTVRAGAVRVEFDNSRAEDAHALATRGADMTFGDIRAGAVVARTFTLAAGTYTLFCPLPQHEALGMRTTLTVTP